MAAANVNITGWLDSSLWIDQAPMQGIAFPGFRAATQVSLLSVLAPSCASLFEIGAESISSCHSGFLMVACVLHFFFLFEIGAESVHTGTFRSPFNMILDPV